MVTSVVVLRHPDAQAFRSAGPADDSRPVQAPRPAPEPVLPPTPGKAKRAAPARKADPASPVPVEASAEAFADKAELQAVPAPPAPPPALAGAAARMAKAAPRAKEVADHAQEPFEARLERLPDGSARLDVVWRQEGHLYVLKRSPAWTVMLAARETLPAAPGSTAAVFAFDLGPQDQVDVYVLAAPAADRSERVWRSTCSTGYIPSLQGLAVEAFVL